MQCLKLILTFLTQTQNEDITFEDFGIVVRIAQSGYTDISLYCTSLCVFIVVLN